MAAVRALQIVVWGDGAIGDVMGTILSLLFFVPKKRTSCIVYEVRDYSSKRLNFGGEIVKS